MKKQKLLLSIFSKKTETTILFGGFLVLFCLLLTFCEPVKEKEPTTGEIVTLVNDAVNLINENGESVFQDFNKEGSKWRKGDTYIFVANMEGKFMVHPNPDLMNKDMLDLEDDSGKPIMKWFIQKAKCEKKGGWTHYQWKKQGEAKPSWKSTYIKLATAPSGEEFLVGCGVYDVKMEKEFAVEAVNEATLVMSTKGDSAAFDIFRDKTSHFLFKGTYIFVMDTAYILVVDPPFPDLEGVNVYEYQDANGKYLFQEFMTVANEQGSGWIDYMWPKPGDTVQSAKSSYIKKVIIDDKQYIVGMGIYLD